MRVPLAVRAIPTVAERAWFTPPRHPREQTQGSDPVPGRPIELTVSGKALRGFEMGEGPLVVLAHGWGGTAASLSRVGWAIAKARFKAVTLDAPGHGSDRQTTSDLFQMAATLGAVVEEYGDPRAVVAHSLGAMASLVAFEDAPPPRAVFLAPGLDVNQLLDTFAVRAQLLPWTSRSLRRRIRRFVGEKWATISAGSDLDWGDTRLLVIHDPADQQTDFHESAALAAKRPDTHLIVAPGLGHRGVLEDPETVDRIIRFIAGERRSPTSR
ncbi:MAG TPA: alpha/beta fold hydrolase [Acidimicrobiia bacterium]|nr:alpha/beta fold hydrolase [Acidimicrobiia bacterium]